MNSIVLTSRQIGLDVRLDRYTYGWHLFLITSYTYLTLTSKERWIVNIPMGKSPAPFNYVASGAYSAIFSLPIR